MKSWEFYVLYVAACKYEVLDLLGEVLGFSVLPSTPEGTRKVPRSGKFVRWALRRCYAGDVTIMKS